MRVLLKLVQLLLIAVAVLGVIVLFYIAINAFFSQPQLFLVLLIPLFVGALMLFIMWTTLATVARRRRASVVLNYLEQAVRLNLPLPRVVQALAESEGGRFARDLEEAKIRLEQGESLATVLEVIPKIPPRIIGLVAAAERAGRLPQVMSRMMEQRRSAASRGLGYMPFYRMYPLILGDHADFSGIDAGDFCDAQVRADFSRFQHRSAADNAMGFLLSENRILPGHGCRCC